MKLLKIGLIGVLSFLFTSCWVYSQFIYVNSGSTLRRVNLSDCSIEHVTSMPFSMFDISFHPDGRLFGIAPNGKIYEIDTITGGVSSIYDFPGQGFNSLVISAKGLLFATGFSGDLWSYDFSTHSGFEHGNIGYSAAGDLIFSNGDLYVSIKESRILKINIQEPSLSMVVIDEDINDEMLGIATYVENCSDIKTYALSNEIHLIDFVNNSLDFFCDYSMNASGATGKFDYYGSIVPLRVNDIVITQPDCLYTTGTIEVITEGGLGELEFSIDGLSFQSNNIFNNVLAGTYTFYVKDEFGCIVYQQITIEWIDALEIEDVITTVPCVGENGSITIIARGGFGTLEYSIDGAAYQENNFFENIPAGNYIVYVRDINNCIIEWQVIINEVDGPLIEDIAIPVICIGEFGSITIVANGGTGSLEYSLDGINYQTSHIFNDLSGGVYTIYVMDKNGCVAEQQVVIDETAGAVIDNVSATPESCTGEKGSIAIMASGGTGPLTYSIDGNSYIVDNTFADLFSGSYIIYVKDENDCITSQSINIEEIEGPIIYDSEVTRVSCTIDDGSITVIAVGGTGQLEYSVDGITFQQSERFNNLPLGTYSVIVKDEIGCTVTQEISLSQAELPSLFILDKTPVTCDSSNGIISIEGEKGTPPYTYSIDGVEYQSVRKFDSLIVGEYHVFVQDAAGCKDSIEVQITEKEPAKISNVRTVATTCGEDNGFTYVTVDEGTSIEYSIDGVNFQSVNNFRYLASGTYTVIIKDENECIDSQRIVVGPSIPVLIDTIDVFNSSCGMNNGSITVWGDKGTGNLSYSLNNNDFQKNQFFPDLPAGDYLVYVRDEVGCLVTTEIELAGSPLLVLEQVNKTPAVCGKANAILSFEITGGTGAIKALLNNTPIDYSKIINDLPSGQYNLMFTDELGCEIDTSIFIYKAECPIFIPNTFSPNGDGVNDFLNAYAHRDFTGNFKTLRIFSRWGDLIYEMNNFNAEDVSWDGTFNGKKLPNGVYVYFVELTSEDGRARSITGDITIIR